MNLFSAPSLSNNNISLAIYDDRIVIASPGQFPRQITPENIKQPHESFPHNLNVAEALFRMTYLENWGSGAKRIIDACHAQNVEEPTWSDHGGFITVTFKRPIKSATVFKNESIVGNVASKEETESLNFRSTTAQPPLNYRPSTIQVQNLILSTNEEYMTMNQLMECVGLRHRTTFRENYLLPALKDSAIGLLYPDTPNHPKQKYSLTEKAKEWKSHNH